MVEYNKKRNLSNTPEPPMDSNIELSDTIFVIQEHHASHLHWDFRLEMEGVLKSWAIPKEPTMDTTVKRLAVMVEDHPYSYKDFEGIIPEGNYGAGEVKIWDNGTYELTDISAKRIKFKLNGNKLKGDFTLLLMNKNNWLLIKNKF